MSGFEDQLVGGQGKAGVFFGEQAFGLRFVVVELAQQPVGIAVFEVVGGLFDFVLVVHVAVGDGVAVERFCPNEVIDVFHALQIHRQAFDAVGDFAEYGGAVDAADLLEVGELGHFHAVEPDFPAQAPCAEGGVFPVVFDEADVVDFGVDAQFAQGVEIEVLDIGGSGFEGDLELVIVLQAVGVVAVAAVFGAAAGLDVGGKPRLGAERAQAGGRVGSTGADFHVERLDDGAAFVCPECLQFEDDLLEGEHGLCFGLG